MLGRAGSVVNVEAQALEADLAGRPGAETLPAAEAELTGTGMSLQWRGCCKALPAKAEAFVDGIADGRAT